jgi:hypothetical protein
VRLTGDVALLEILSRPGYRCQGYEPVDLAAKATAGAPDLRPHEDEVQATCCRALELHPLVVWGFRMNAGGVWRENKDGTRRYIKYGWPGMLDWTGMLVGGRRCDIEFKRIGEVPTADQQATIDRINGGGGLAFVAHSVDDIYSAIPLRPTR